MTDTYTNRYVAWDRIAKIDHRTLTGEGGWSCLPPAEVVTQLHVGDEYGTETIGGPFGRIAGFTAHGRWLSRKSDQQMDREHAEMLAEIARERRERLDVNRSDWIARDEALPDWLHERMATFHQRGGEQFRLDGWGYELCVAELAALYAENGCEDNDEVNAYADAQGTSGNQHGCAKALARAHLDGQSIRDTVSALSPLTGDAFYEKSSGETKP